MVALHDASAMTVNYTTFFLALGLIDRHWPVQEPFVRYHNKLFIGRVWSSALRIIWRWSIWSEKGSRGVLVDTSVTFMLLYICPLIGNCEDRLEIDVLRKPIAFTFIGALSLCWIWVLEVLTWKLIPTASEIGNVLSQKQPEKNISDSNWNRSISL